MPTEKPAGSAEWTDPDDAPEPTAKMLARAETFHGDTFLRQATAQTPPRGRGRPKSAAAKQQISVRLDPDVLAALRAAGPGWQLRINALLRRALRIARPAAKRPA